MDEPSEGGACPDRWIIPHQVQKTKDADLIPGTGVWNTSVDTSQEYWTYSWDLLNRMTGANHYTSGTTPDVVTGYVYDASGLRVQRTGTNGTTRYIYSTSGVLLESQSSQLTRTIAYMGQTTIGWTDTTTGSSGTVSTRYYAATDQLGSVTAVMDISGTVVWNSEYTPFGAVAGARGTYDFNGIFTGKDIDPDTGLYYYNARWYDPTLGRFLSEDPAGQGSNWYSYCGSSPLVNTDPSGKIFWMIPFIIAAVIGAEVGGAEANGGNFNPFQWTWNSQTFGAMGMGALIGITSTLAGAEVLGLCTDSTGASIFAAWGAIGSGIQGGLVGAASGAVGGFLNSWTFGNMKKGMFSGDLQQDFEAAAYGAATGFVGGFAQGAVFGFPQQTDTDKDSFTHFAKGLSDYTMHVEREAANSGEATLAAGANFSQKFISLDTGGTDLRLTSSGVDASLANFDREGVPIGGGFSLSYSNQASVSATYGPFSLSVGGDLGNLGSSYSVSLGYSLNPGNLAAVNLPANPIFDAADLANMTSVVPAQLSFPLNGPIPASLNPAPPFSTKEGLDFLHVQFPGLF